MISTNHVQFMARYNGWHLPGITTLLPVLFLPHIEVELPCNLFDLLL